MKLTLVYFALMALAGRGPSPPMDEMVLRDGTRLRGQLVSWNRGEVVFQTEEGRRRLAPAQILRLSMGSQSIQVVTKALPEVKPPVPPVQWELTAELGYTGKRGTVSSDSSALSLKAARITEHNRISFDSRYFYAVQDELVSGNQLIAGGRWDHFVSGRLFVFGSAELETNKVERVDFRGVFSTGLGYDALSTERAKLSLSAGAGYTQEQFADATRHKAPSSVLKEELLWKLGSRAELEQSLRYLQDLSALGRFKLRVSATWRTKLSAFLRLSVGLVESYDHQPPAGAENNEVTFLTGLGLAF